MVAVPELQRAFIRAGKRRLEGKAYVMQEYDAVNFRLNK